MSQENSLPCPFCSQQLTLVQVGERPIYLCSHCHSTVVNSDSWGGIRINLDAGSMREWVTFIKNTPHGETTQSAVQCVFHQQPVQGNQATCCDTLYLPPQALLEKLERALKLPDQHPSMKKNQTRGFFKKIAAFFDPAPSADEDPFAGLTWAMVIHPAITGKH